MQIVRCFVLINELRESRFMRCIYSIVTYASHSKFNLRWAHLAWAVVQGEIKMVSYIIHVRFCSNACTLYNEFLFTKLHSIETLDGLKVKLI